MEKILTCKCGDCSHWEIGKTELGEEFILCVTCGQRHFVSFFIHPHEKLHYREASK